VRAGGSTSSSSSSSRRSSVIVVVPAAAVGHWLVGRKFGIVVLVFVVVVELEDCVTTRAAAYAERIGAAGGTGG
jgi:hypothetical protein